MYEFPEELPVLKQYKNEEIIFRKDLNEKKQKV